MQTGFPQKSAQSAIFLDRDGVINRERGEYTFRLNDFEILPGVHEALQSLKASGYQLIVITNQAGIAKGLYTREELRFLHDEMCRNLPELDAVYYSPWHESRTLSLGRKPGCLLFERAIAKHGIDPESSWMVGDKARDLIPARQLGLHTALISDTPESVDPALVDVHAKSLLEFAETILRGE
jgi:D-glycero-D-manno-heptose 1,7-bisphosphate phosphatase